MASQVFLVGTWGKAFSDAALRLCTTEGQAGPIFTVIPQAGKDLSLQASFSLMTGCLSGVLKWIVVPYCLEFVCFLLLLWFTFF